MLATISAVMCGKSVEPFRADLYREEEGKGKEGSRSPIHTEVQTARGAAWMDGFSR